MTARRPREKDSGGANHRRRVMDGIATRQQFGEYAQAYAPVLPAAPQTVSPRAPAASEEMQPVAKPKAEAKAVSRAGVKVWAALLLVAAIGSILTTVSISALAVQVPTDMPFGVTGASSVLTGAQSANLYGRQVSFVNTTYASEADAMTAISQGKIYGAFIPGKTGDTLLAVPQKSFFAATEVTQLFTTSAAKLGRPLAVKVVKPLPQGMDPVGAVAGLLLLPLVVGGLLSAILVTKATHGKAAHWRVALLAGYSLVGATLTLLIAGPWMSAFASNRFWPLLLVAFGIEVTVALVTAALMAILPGAAGVVLALMAFVIVGLPTAGTAGASLLPSFWQTVGGLLPPHAAGMLILNTLYFSSHNIAGPVTVLALYAVVAAVVLVILGWMRRRAAAGGAGEQDASASVKAPSGKLAVKVLAGVLVVAGLEQCLFTTNYVSSSHNPASNNMPFAATGDTALVKSVQKNMSLSVTQYSDEAAAKTAIDQGKAWGALVAGKTNNTLLVVPTASDLAPLNLAVQFEKSAKEQKQKLAVDSYAPQALPSGDPFGLVLSMLLTPLLVCGYMVATMLRTVTRAPVQRYRGLWFLGFAAVTALEFDLIALAFNGIPADKFWVAWPVMAMTMLVVSLFAAIMQRFFGAAGTLIAVVVMVLFGKPSAGGANGIPYLPSFWSNLGVVLPPQNAYSLLKNSVYFGGNGITRQLIVMFLWLTVLAVILTLLDWYKRPEPKLPISAETEAQAAAASVPAGVAL